MVFCQYLFHMLAIANPRFAINFVLAALCVKLLPVLNVDNGSPFAVTFLYDQRGQNIITISIPIETGEDVRAMEDPHLFLKREHFPIILELEHQSF